MRTYGFTHILNVWTVSVFPKPQQFQLTTAKEEPGLGGENPPAELLDWVLAYCTLILLEVVGSRDDFLLHLMLAQHVLHYPLAYDAEF